jgi:hypothetical protein
MTFNVSQSFYSNIYELSPWWLKVSDCLTADKETYDRIWLNESVPVQTFFQFLPDQGSGRNFNPSTGRWLGCKNFSEDSIAVQ